MPDRQDALQNPTLISMVFFGVALPLGLVLHDGDWLAVVALTFAAAAGAGAAHGD